MQVKDECSNHGEVLTSLVCGPTHVADWAAAREGTIVGDVFVEFDAVNGAQAAFKSLQGRLFAGRSVQCGFCDAESFGQIKEKA